MVTATVHGDATGAAPVPDVIVDSSGRTLKIRELDLLQESRLTRTMGVDAANATYMSGYVFPAAMIAAIDGQAIALPTTDIEVEAAIQRMGRAGQSALLEYLQAKARKSEELDEGAIKNSPGTQNS